MRSNRISIKLACCCLLVFACALLVQAQSGRRQQRVEPAAPIPTPTPEPTPVPKTDKKDSDWVLFVGMDRNGAFAQFPYTYYDAALAGCAEELRKKAPASVDFATKDLSRVEAINKAKSDAKTYVVYLQLRNSMSSSPTSTQSGEQAELEYIVFAPTTAKIVVSGTSFQNARRAGPVILGPPGGGSASQLYRYELLKRAGEDAAERIIKSLHLGSDPKTK